MVNQRCLCFDGVSSVCGHRGFSYHKTGVIYICGKGKFLELTFRARTLLMCYANRTWFNEIVLLIKGT